MIFLLVTGTQSFRTSARLALFTNKLAFVILLAALIRVREGLPSALQAFSDSAGCPAALIAVHNLSHLAFYVGPLAFLAADFGYRLQSRREVAMTGAFGLVLPLFGTVLLVAIIGLATNASSYYQPSLEPTVAMALWSRAAGSALPGRVMIAVITTFGAGRFGARALTNVIAISNLSPRSLRVLLACFCGVIAWFSLHPYDTNLSISSHTSAAFLTVTAAVLTGDFVNRRSRQGRLCRIDWLASSALAMGLSAFFLTRSWVSDTWWEPGLFPSYGITFVTCVIGRALQQRCKGFRAPLPSSPTH